MKLRYSDEEKEIFLKHVNEFMFWLSTFLPTEFQDCQSINDTNDREGREDLVAKLRFPASKMLLKLRLVNYGSINPSTQGKDYQYVAFAIHQEISNDRFTAGQFFEYNPELRATYYANIRRVDQHYARTGEFISLDDFLKIQFSLFRELFEKHLLNTLKGLEWTVYSRHP